MGIIKRGILGGFSKKVANVVGSSWKGIAYMRSLPLSVANPRTPAQVNQRNSFARLSKLGSAALHLFCIPFWNHLAVRMSGFNFWLQSNVEFAPPGSPMEWDKIKMAKGSYGIVELISAEYDEESGVVELEWNTSGESGNSDPLDKLTVMVYNSTSQALAGSNTTSNRMSGANSIQVGRGLSDQVLHVYVACKSPLGAQSDSTYMLVDMD